MKSEAVMVAREQTAREMVKALTHPALLFVGGIYAINWMADKPGGMGQAQAVVLEGLLAAVCAGAAIAPAFPKMMDTSAEMVKVLTPALGALAVLPK